MSSLIAYRKLIGRVSLDAYDSPQRYRRKAIIVALFGHAVIGGLLLLCLALVAAGIVLRGETLGIAMLSLGLILPTLLLRALWVELPRPVGESLDSSSAPKLWEMLDKLHHKLHAPRIDEVIINEEHGLRIEHFPRWVFFGPARHVLIVGLPWLLSLSPKQAAAGIAQEYARLGNRHGLLIAMLARHRDFWPRYVEALPGFITSPTHRIVARYANYLSAYTLPFASELTNKADQAAAKCVGAERTAQVIIRSKVIGQWLNLHFWPEFMRAADDMPVPERLPFHSMIAALRAADQSIGLRRSYQEEMQRKRSVEDIAPTLSNRLRLLNQKAELTGMPEHTAAEHLLGAQLMPVIKALDKVWCEREQPFWRKRHEAVQGARLWLASFGEPDVEQLNIETLSQYAHALLTIGARDKALPLLRRAAEHPEGTAETAWSVAQIMLEHDEEDALPYLDLTMDRDAFRAREAAELALEIAERQGRRDRIGHYRRCVEQLAA